MAVKKKKVCILQNGLARGGTDTFVVNLCKAIDKNMFEITIVNPSSKANNRVCEPEILTSGVKIIHTSDLDGGLKSKFHHFKKLYHILKKGEFDVFQTNIDLFNGPNLFVAWCAGVPIRCCHSHNTMQQRALVQGMTLSVRIYQSVMKWLCWHFSNRRVGCSKAAMDFLFTGYNWNQKQYPIVINNGIDIEKFRQLFDVEKKKRELGLTAKYNVVTVGRIIPQKNPLFIAEVFSEFCKLYSDCDLVWVGTGPMDVECKQILADNGVQERVHFLGSRSDVNEILQCCDMFYMPSIFEGLGIAIIEAQAAGLPCLVSDAVPREADCGACHFVSLNEDKSVWVQKMIDILECKIDLTVIEEKIQLFSVAYMAKQMQQVFK